MGINCCIYIKTTDGNPVDIHQDFVDCVKISDKEYTKDATHEIVVPWRYYSPTYRRGPWNRIACILMYLYSLKNVEKIWYFGDSNELDEPFTIHQVAAYSYDYMMNVNDA